MDCLPCVESCDTWTVQRCRERRDQDNDGAGKEVQVGRSTCTQRSTVHHPAVLHHKGLQRGRRSTEDTQAIRQTIVSCHTWFPWNVHQNKCLQYACQFFESKL